ncbi:MAG: SIS domain-containing protein [Coprobacillaceae bacterium]
MENKPTMLSYIYEEQDIMLSILNNYPKNMDESLKKVNDNTNEWLILGTGSSINAARSAKYYIENKASVRIDIQEPFNYCHYETINPHIDLVLGISQSGQSTSTIEALERIKATSKLTIISVTSIANSEITQYTTSTLDIGCGKERVGYVTLGFTSTILSLMLFGLRLGVKKGLLSKEEEKQEINLFKQETAKINSIIKKTEDFFTLHRKDFKEAPRFSAIGYGSIVGTVKEMETKFSETVRVPSQGFELEAYMHGPYLEVNPEHRIFFVETKSPRLQKANLLKAYESKHTNHVFTITTENNSNDDKTLALDIQLDEYQAPYLMIIPFQILCWFIAKEKGIDLTKRIYTDFAQSVNSKTTVQDYV